MLQDFGNFLSDAIFMVKLQQTVRQSGTAIMTNFNYLNKSGRCIASIEVMRSLAEKFLAGSLATLQGKNTPEAIKAVHNEEVAIFSGLFLARLLHLPDSESMYDALQWANSAYTKQTDKISEFGESLLANIDKTILKPQGSSK